MRLLTDEEIRKIVGACDYKDAGVSCPMPITPFRYERATAQAQLALDQQHEQERVERIKKELEGKLPYLDMLSWWQDFWKRELGK
jgi:hypothetical protein